jgi:DNA helicase-4
MRTYDELEAKIEAQQSSLLFSLKQFLFGYDGIDAEEAASERERVKSRSRAIREETQSVVDRVEKTVETPQETGEALPETLDIGATELEEKSERISSFRSSNGNYLRSDEHETLSSLSSTAADLATYLRAKREFDDELARVTPRLESLFEDAAPYLEYDAYLTAPDEQRLEQSIPAARDALDSLREAVDIGALASGDHDRMERLEARVDSVGDVLDEYNETFVRRQRTEYESLFTEIDDAGHSLNPAQQRAIVRNGYYNQVVAGAGTGKTFALIYRIAYLVQTGVDASRIVALTYTKEAATEMETRLENEFGITNVEVRTIHSFAYRIAQETGNRNRSVAQSRDTYNLIKSVLEEEEGSESEFTEHYVQFLYHYDDDFLDEADFHEKTDYVAERKERTYETLGGEEVASEAEKVIADFLFTHNIAYRYEAIAEWAATAEGKPYRPDFYLPDDDIYIEHWGLDENGEVAPWFSWSSDEYLEKLYWAREEFQRGEPELIGTYEFEHESGRLERALEHRLEAAGVELGRMSFDEFVDDVFEYNEKRGDIEDSFKQFIENAKTFDVAPEEIPDRLDRSKPRQYHFGHCGREMLERYDAYLQRNELLDFDDMIYDAIEAIETDPASFQDRYDHVLVDEFQDVAMSQIRLVRPFVGPDAGTRLFCVGDDWQSIYSFQGSQVEYFVNFGDHFGPPAPVVTRLTANYRCPESAIEASNELIANNEAQIEKTVEAHSGRDTAPVLHTLDGYRNREYERRVGTYAADLVEGFVDERSDPSEVMVLCRYDGGAAYLDELKDELEHRDIPYDGKDDTFRPADMPGEYEDGFEAEAGVSAFSVHQAKGREAKHVVLLHAATGPMGFPPDDRDDDLIAPVQDVPTNTTAEERRLFYVALTRATDDLHVMTRAGKRSPFVTEIESFFEERTSLITPGEEGDRVSVTARVDRLWEDTHETQQQAGVLEDTTGTSKFVAWKNDNPPEVVADTWYKLEELRVNEYNGEQQLVIDDSSHVIELFNEQPLRTPDDEADGDSRGVTAPTADPAGTDQTPPSRGERGSDTGGIPPAIPGAPAVDVSYDALEKDSDPIGRGGNAVVYATRLLTEHGERHLAIKEPDQRDTVRAETVERFLDEADTWAVLADHDHIVDIVGSGSQPLPWIAMEYMDGGDLHSRLGSLPFEQAVWTVLAITKAIRYAHNRGVRHYDLKPQNVLFRSSGGGYWDVPKVADWGLAERALRSETSSEGMTPAYAAPEQLFEAYGEPDHRTDIYQLGLLCYELFTGEHPYDGDQTQVRSEPLSPPSEVAPSAPEAMDTIVEHALAVDPADRYEDVLDFRRALESLR